MALNSPYENCKHALAFSPISVVLISNSLTHKYAKVFQFRWIGERRRREQQSYIEKKYSFFFFFFSSVEQSDVKIVHHANERFSISNFPLNPLWIWMCCTSEITINRQCHLIFGICLLLLIKLENCLKWEIRNKMETKKEIHETEEKWMNEEEEEEEDVQRKNFYSTTISYFLESSSFGKHFAARHAADGMSMAWIHTDFQAGWIKYFLNICVNRLCILCVCVLLMPWKFQYVVQENRIMALVWWKNFK